MPDQQPQNASIRRDDLSDDEFRELHGVYLSRLMFNEFVGWPPETRTFEEYVEARRG